MLMESFRSFSLTNTTMLSGLTPRQNLLKMANARLQDAQVFRMSKVIRLCRSSKDHMVTHSKEKAHACVDAISHLVKLNI